MKRTPPLVIFSADPGVRNYGFCVLEIKPSPPTTKKVRWRILSFGRLLTTVADLKEPLSKQFSLHKEALELLKSQFNASFFIAERFQSRGMGGTTIESVNIMLGAGLSVYNSHPRKIITASQWKNAAAKVELWFDDVQREVHANKITNHAVDAVCISLYAASLLLKRSTPFDFVTQEDLKRELLIAHKRGLHVDVGISPPAKPPKKKRKPKNGKTSLRSSGKHLPHIKRPVRSPRKLPDKLLHEQPKRKVQP